MPQVFISTIILPYHSSIENTKIQGIVSTTRFLHWGIWSLERSDDFFKTTGCWSSTGFWDCSALLNSHTNGKVGFNRNADLKERRKMTSCLQNVCSIQGKQTVLFVFFYHTIFITNAETSLFIQGISLEKRRGILIPLYNQMHYEKTTYSNYNQTHPLCPHLLRFCLPMTAHNHRSFLQMPMEGVAAHCTTEPFPALSLTDWVPVGTRRMQWVCAVSGRKKLRKRNRE